LLYAEDHSGYQERPWFMVCCFSRLDVQAQNGDLELATSGDFFMAMDNNPAAV